MNKTLAIMVLIVTIIGIIGIANIYAELEIEGIEITSDPIDTYIEDIKKNIELGQDLFINNMTNEIIQKVK